MLLFDSCVAATVSAASVETLSCPAVRLPLGSSARQATPWPVPVVSYESQNARMFGPLPAMAAVDSVVVSVELNANAFVPAAATGAEGTPFCSNVRPKIVYAPCLHEST